MPHLPSPSRAVRLRPRVAALLLGATFGLSVLAALAPAPVSAAWIPRAPWGQYSPHHVQQLKNNCVWAAGQMLLDKWTHGRVRVSQSELRHASGTKGKSATLLDLARGISGATGILLHSSPGMGDPMTWWQLLDRLEHGGGGVIIGQYSRLPAAFTRWNPAFAARPDSGHALYVERYDRTHARVWLMDPLAPRDFRGEWIPVEELRKFATFHGQLVLAAATPARHRPSTAPLSDHAYRLDAPVLSGPAIAGSTIRVRARLRIRDDFPVPAAHRFVARWEPLPSGLESLPLARRSLDGAPDEPAPPPSSATTTASALSRPVKGGFAGVLRVPAKPGVYRLTLGLRPKGVRAVARSFVSVEIEVLPAYAASLSVPRSIEARSGQQVRLEIGIRNIGTLDWQSPPDADKPSRPGQPAATTLLLTWHSAQAGDRLAASLPAELGPGAGATVQLDLAAPREPGDWWLVMDVFNADLGSLSTSGYGSLQVPVRIDATGNPTVLNHQPV